jgi:peptide methionine sulfoxide reductase MsrA
MNFKKIIIDHGNSTTNKDDIFDDLDISFTNHNGHIAIEYDPSIISHQELLTRLVKLRMNIKDIKIEDNDLEEIFIKLVNE